LDRATPMIDSEGGEDWRDNLVQPELTEA
jgi:hypothetical protein